MTWPTRLKIATISSLESTNSWIKSQSSRRGSGTRPSASSRPKMSPRRSVWDVWSQRPRESCVNASVLVVWKQEKRKKSSTLPNGLVEGEDEEENSGHGGPELQRTGRYYRISCWKKKKKRGRKHMKCGCSTTRSPLTLVQSSDL